MADEFNPQGVDQTPRNNENPNSTADTGNAEPKNPFVGGDSVDAGNASDSSEQQAPVSSAALAADQQPTQAATDTCRPTEPIPGLTPPPRARARWSPPRRLLRQHQPQARPRPQLRCIVRPRNMALMVRPRLRHRASRAARPAAMPSPRSNSRSVSLHSKPHRASRQPQSLLHQ